MIEKDEFIAQLTTKLADKDKQVKIDDKIQAIVNGIDYELRKFHDSRANFVLSLSPNISSLYQLSSFQEFNDQQNGIRRVVQEIMYIRDNYNVDLTNDVRKYVYAHLNNLDEKYFQELAPKYADKLKNIIQNRDVWPQTRIIQQMQAILNDLLSSKSAECRQLVKLMLQVDPFFQGWRNSEEYHTFFPATGHAHHHASDDNSLNLDFFNPVINFLTNIYKKFSDKQEVDEKVSEDRFNKKM